MDFYGIHRGTIRADALKKLAQLTTEQNTTNLQEIDHSTDSVDNFARLVSFSPDTVNDALSNVAITPREYETLIALCDSTEGEFKFPSHAKLLISKFRVYLLELPKQKFSNHLINSAYSSSPWTIAAQKLTSSLVNLALKFEQFLDQVIDIFHEFNEKFFILGDFELSHYFTLLGYIQGFTKKPKLLTLSPRAFTVFTHLDSSIDNFEFLNDVEIYSNVVYSELEYPSYMLEREYVANFSPILYLEKLSILMCSLINLIFENDDKDLLDCILSRVSSDGDSLAIIEQHMDILKSLTRIATQKMEFLDRGELYIVYSTYNRLRLGYLSKSYNLQVISCGMFTDNIDVKSATRLFKNCLEIKDVMLDPDLGLSAIQLGALLVFKDEAIGSSLTRSFTNLVSDPKFSHEYCLKASKSVGLACKVLSQDAVVTTIYALTNLLFVGNASSDKANYRRTNTLTSRLDLVSIRDGLSRRNSFSSANGNGFADNDLDEADYTKVCENATTAIVEITKACDDDTITTLAVTLLSQKTAKLDSSIGSILLRGLVSCGPYLPEREFIILVQLLNKTLVDALLNNNIHLLQNLTWARCDLSSKLQQSNPLYKICLHEILQSVSNKGDVQVLEHHRSHNEIVEVAAQICVYLKPLAALLPDVHSNQKPLEIKDTETIKLFRNFWFNLVVHGFSVNSSNSKAYLAELERIAYNSPPLASELSWDRTETSLELNTILRRGSLNHNVKDHKHIIGDIFDILRLLSYPKLMFLSATVYVESLRVKTGDCSKILNYYSDPSVKTSGVEKHIGQISIKIVRDFIHLVNCGANKQFSADNIAQQLTNMLVLCCYRVEDLQDAALQCCDLLINKIPSSLCHQKSLFALFDILTLLFDSLVDADKHLYDPTTLYRAQKTGIHLLLPDSYKWRTDTFNRFQEKAKHWMKLIILKCNVDSKSLIQAYVSDVDRFPRSQKILYGVSFALEMAGSILSNERELSHISRHPTNDLNTLPLIVSQLSWRSNFVTELMHKVPLHTEDDSDRAFFEIRAKVESLKKNHAPEEKSVIALLSDIAGLVLISDLNHAELVRYIVEIPFAIFDAAIMQASISIWFAVMKERPNLSMLLISELALKWETSIELKKGVFSASHDIEETIFSVMEYAPSDNKLVNKKAHATSKSFEPHLQIIRLFSSNFEATMNQSDHLLKLFTRFVEVGLKNLRIASLHPFSRLVRFELIRFAYDILNYHTKLGSREIVYLTELIFDASLSWFKKAATYPFGGNVLKIKADYILLKDISRLVSHTSTYHQEPLESKKTILMFFLDDEISKITVWLNPLNPIDLKSVNEQINGNHIIKSYTYDPILAVNLALRYKVKNLDDLLQTLISKNPLPAISYPQAVQFFIGINGGSVMPTHHLMFWEPLGPIDAITLFLPPFGHNPYILQYTVRSLEHHDVNLTFFYVPQIVQSLRFDAKGYVEKFIIETGKVSQLFAHQIIWNMLANSFKDEESTIPDSIKPILDKIQVKMKQSFEPEDLIFYEREFSFFNEVTDISGKLKPYIKKLKAEKKVKIDEEMYKIVVAEGVYLPSNPDGIVIDINRKSGKPLQSHAKAPFMATFKIRKEIEDIDNFGNTIKIPLEKWQSAIFKVGDDCRQDVLALQLISVFRTVWKNAGLDLYVNPYRVTATAPGCGVIDVLPNSISRDMLGREAVNGLYEYFITKFGSESSIEFQQARNNLIKSLAAYSIISYILQFKDRHNGNIMYDDQGHVLHIDFGFCFDIVPGGVRFEMAPFKLTHEMVLVLGGSSNTQAFKWFEELCIKGYLACRPHMETIVRCVNPMLESGLPCFKDQTIKKLRLRFVPYKNDKDASIYMRGLINKSMESNFTKGYDEFQKITNGIPY